MTGILPTFVSDAVLNVLLLSSLPLSLILLAYERVLTPLYGSVPTMLHLYDVGLGAACLAAIHPPRLTLARRLFVKGVLLSIAPSATYWMAVWTSRRQDPIWGPVCTHLVVLAPTTVCFMKSATEFHSQSGSTLLRRLAFAIVSYISAVSMYKYLWRNQRYLYSVSDNQIYLGLAGSAFAFWILCSPVTAMSSKRTKKSRLSPAQLRMALMSIFLSFWLSLSPLLSSPVLPHPLKETYTHPTLPLQVHYAVQSVTGLIIVAEALPPPGHNGEFDQDMHSVRYLRASHSILGGAWTKSKVHVIDDAKPLTDSYGTELGDSIYATFVLQEAVRLVNSTDIGRTESWSNALVIGLGTGVSTTAFMRHNISTTIVEIDPAVYEAARRFFGLPDSGSVFVQDARKWVSDRATQSEAANKSYDIVVHDCFSGGGVPEHIFTLEFWEDLKKVLLPEGIVVVNFAGVPKSESSKMILHTLEKSIGQCRAFHDMVNDLREENYDVAFINIVFFCTQSSRPLTFRTARDSDYLGSPLRRHILNSLSEREVNLDIMRAQNNDDLEKYILTDEHNPFGKLQDAQAIEHWKLMREVLPNGHWETF